MRSGTSAGQLKMWGSERGVSWAQWSQDNGQRWDQMCEWVRRVCPMRERVRMISRRRDSPHPLENEILALVGSEKRVCIDLIY